MFLQRGAAARWIGRYLYALTAVWVQLDSGGRVPETTLARLRDRLAQRKASA